MGPHQFSTSWTNAEDEVLKAGVMKYGNKNWGRVGSLLSRKTAGMCKARWYEWLDPMIKKLEWTREEDEKLLHLAKLMPSQWRTIAPAIGGRTALQCLERYEKLIDMAQGDENAAKALREARRLRPGEIDPNPESKPARPDAIDMALEDKEMLAEARARLANTSGKKEMRKARQEKMDEAERVARLQKIRELKAAGLSFEHLLGAKKLKANQIDHNSEVAFQIPVPVGRYDVAEELREGAEREALSKFNPLVRKPPPIERNDRALKRQRMRDKFAERANVAMTVARAAERNDPLSQKRKRTALVLPPPQISSDELDAIAKLGAAGVARAKMLRAEKAKGTASSKALLGDHSMLSAVSTLPQRTPALKKDDDRILEEARNQAATLDAETPLAGGENAPLGRGTGFSGVAPEKVALATPSSLALSVGARSKVGTTLTAVSASSYAPSMRSSSTHRGAPIVDELNINRTHRDPSDDDIISAEVQEVQRKKRVKFDIRAAFANLPDPKFAYDVSAPQKQAQSCADENMDVMEEDAGDVDARRVEAQKRAEQVELEKRPEAMKRGLPLPSQPPTVAFTQSFAGESGDLAAAEKMIHEELQTMLVRDHAKYVTRETSSALQSEFNADAVGVARQLIEMEATRSNTPLEEFVDIYLRIRNERELARISSAEGLDAKMSRFGSIRERMGVAASSSMSAERKARLVTAGHIKRAAALGTEFDALRSEYVSASTQLDCFSLLRRSENVEIERRLCEAKQRADAARADSERLSLRIAELKKQEASFKKLLVKK